MKSRLACMLMLSLVVFSCGDSQNGAPWSIDSDQDEETAQSGFDFGPSCTVPQYPGPQDYGSSDDVIFLGHGATLADARLVDSALRAFSDVDERAQARFAGDVSAKAAIIDANSYGDFLPDGLWYDMYRFDWAQKLRVNLHEVLLRDIDLHQLSYPLGSDGQSSYAVFAFRLQGANTSLGRPDVLGSPTTDTLARFVDNRGIGYVESVQHGGYEVLSVNLELLDEEREQILRRFIAAHTDEAHNVDLDQLTESLESQDLPAIGFAASEQQGLHSADPDLDIDGGDDLFATLQAIPGRIEEAARQARERVENGARGISLGVRIDRRVVRYQREQLEATNLTDAQLDAFDCYADFLIEANTAARAARSYAASARCFEDRAGDASYADLEAPLERAADQIEARIDTCQGALSEGGTARICDGCRMPEGASLADVRELADPIPMLEQRPLFDEDGRTATP